MPRPPESAGLIFNLQFGETLRRSVEAIVVLGDKECPQTCASRGITEHISAAECWVGLNEGSPVLFSPCGREEGTSTHVSVAHDDGAAGAPENGGIARPLQYALRSRVWHGVLPIMPVPPTPGPSQSIECAS